MAKHLPTSLFLFVNVLNGLQTFFDGKISSMSSLNELNLMHFTIANVSRNQFSATQSGKTLINFS